METDKSAGIPPDIAVTLLGATRMNQPKKAFNEVRAILGKLDRSREELRQKPPPSENPRPVAPAPVPPSPAPAALPRPGMPMQTAPARPVNAPPTPGSKYGRAQPIRPPSSEPLGRWNAPGQ
jgi:hypothetical protein